MTLSLVERFPERLGAKATGDSSTFLCACAFAWDKASFIDHAKDRTERASILKAHQRQVLTSLIEVIPPLNTILTNLHANSYANPLGRGQPDFWVQV